MVYGFHIGLDLMKDASVDQSHLSVLTNGFNNPIKHSRFISFYVYFTGIIELMENK